MSIATTIIMKPATRANLTGVDKIDDVIDRVALAPNSNTVPGLYTRHVIVCMYFIPESCSHDTLLTAFHGFIRVLSME